MGFEQNSYWILKTLKKNYMSESNSCREYFPYIDNSIIIRFQKILQHLQYFLQESYFSYRSYYFPMGYYFFNSQHLTCQVRHTITKSGYILSRHCFFFFIYMDLYDTTSQAGAKTPHWHWHNYPAQCFQRNQNIILIIQLLKSKCSGD